MRIQTELFPLSTGFRPDLSQVEPRLWVRELRVYRVFAPGSSNLLRAIKLRAGLNILWARPSGSDGPPQLHTPGVSGHGTGKTTFCRFIRHVLGEPSFGNDEQRQRLREIFRDGWIVGEVRLSGETWVVARPFKIGAHSMAYRSRSLDTLFQTEDGRVPFDEYLRALDAALAEPLPVATFATMSTPIGWTHLIQWLTRDQECRFAGLADFRHPTSDSSSPDTSVEDRHFLFRAILQLIDTTEQAELEKNKTFVVKRQLAEKSAPLLRFRSSSAYRRLRTQFPEFRQDLDGSRFLRELATNHTAATEGAERELAQLTESPGLNEARAQLLQIQAVLLGVSNRKKEAGEIIEWLRQQLSALRGETSAADFETWMRDHVAPNRFCGQPLSAAIEWDCPLVRGRLLPIEKSPTDKAPLNESLLNQQMGIEEEKFRLLEAEQRTLELAFLEAERVLKHETSAFDRLRGDLAEQVATSRSIAAEALRAAGDEAEAEDLERSFEEWDKKIRISQELQATLREQRGAALSAFSDTFARISRAVLGNDVTGSIRFRGRQIRPTLEHGIDLTSAALETLKIICFDLAALISGVEGRGAHPRFLLHDGPREADMDAGLYQRIFLIVAELEAMFGPRPASFQYIITTTEPPPEKLQTDPWLLSPVFGAREPGLKFLGEDF